MKKFAFLLSFLLCTEICFSKDVVLSYSGSGGYSLVERTNLRRYENGKYVGLTSREVRSFISPSDSYDSSKRYENDLWFDGNFYVSQDTVRNKKTVNDGIHNSITSIFHIGSDGRMAMYEDNGYPSFRSFPAYTTNSLKIGDSWKSEGERAVDPLDKGVITKIPIIVQYTFEGEEKYQGEKVYRIKAIWQTNYGMTYKDYNGDKDLKKARGGHKADIIVLKSTGQPFMILDTVDETFVYSDGKEINFKGTITMFTEFPAAVDHGKLLKALNRIASESKTEESGKKKTKALGGGSTGSITTVNKTDTDDDSKSVNKDFEKNSSFENTENHKKTENSKNGSFNDDKSEKFSDGTSKKIDESKNKNFNNSESEKSVSKNTNKTENADTEKTRVDTEKESLDSKKDKSVSGNVSKTENTDIEKTKVNAEKENLDIKKGKSGVEKRNSDTKDVKSNKETDSKSVSKSKTSKTEKNSYSKVVETFDSGVAVQLEAAKNDMIFEDTNSGLRLRIQNINFQPDSAELVLGTEGSRLDDIAKVLKLAPKSKFLIEGHTASVGKPAGEQLLSEQRARKIATELVNRGVPADSFICRGWGGKKPLMPNDTNAGRSINRRVEITILE